MLNWDSLQSACLSCTRCPLSQTRHHVVFGVGPQDAEVLFVGDSEHDFEIATELGARCVLYSRGHQARRHLESFAVPVIDDLREVAQLVLAG